MAPRPKRYAAVSLFSGCGGMDLGAEQSDRARIVWAIDNEHWAVETYKRNLGQHIVEGDITVTPVPDVPCDILLAGPPCQDYSTLWNHDGLITARGNLFKQVARYLDTLRPAAFVLENVPGLGQVQGRGVRRRRVILRGSWVRRSVPLGWPPVLSVCR